MTTYTGDDETGHALLIFVGDGIDAAAFVIGGSSVSNVDNDTNQTWYLYDEEGEKNGDVRSGIAMKQDASVAPGTAENIPAVNGEIANTKTMPTSSAEAMFAV